MNDLVAGILAVVLHEVSHVIAARLQGLRVKRFGINWKGPFIVREAGAWQQNLRVCLAGPAVNLILGFLCWHIATAFAVCNLVLAGFNLLPIPGSDGSRAWKLLPFVASHQVARAPSTAAPE